MLKKINTDAELALLRQKKGYILNVNSINKVIKLHLTSCRYCNPYEVWGIKVNSKMSNKTGETWFSLSKEEARELNKNKSYEYSPCRVCNP